MHSLSEITQIVTALKCWQVWRITPKKATLQCRSHFCTLRKKRGSPSSRSRRNTSYLGRTGPSDVWGHPRWEPFPLGHKVLELFYLRGAKKASVMTPVSWHTAAANKHGTWDFTYGAANLPGTWEGGRPSGRLHVARTYWWWGRSGERFSPHLEVWLYFFLYIS